MNVYGYFPASYFPSHSTLTYWAQAASFAGLPSAESTLTATGFVLGLKKSQLPLANGDVLHKASALSPCASDDLASLFGANPRLSTHSADSMPALLNNGSIDVHAHIYHHQQQMRKQQQQQIQHHHHHFFSSSPPLGSGLGPLQALCQSDVSAFISKTSAISDSSNSSTELQGKLKFGMSRILSDDFGKIRCEKENFQLSSVPESCRSLPLCPCNSAACSAYARPPSPYSKASLPSLSAVHALQPPTYPLSSSADALPGPYSILSTDSCLANQPKRKRSWSRAVFSNLQRKGLEKRFEVQKYVTKPDRRQLAAMLGLTDAQVKVWFQNRRMKWRHAQQQGEKEKQNQQPDQQQEKKNSTHSSDSCDVDTSTLMEGRTGDVNVPESSRDSVSGADLTDREAVPSGPSRAAAQCQVQSRQGCTSPQDLRVVALRVSDCPRDSRITAASLRDTTEEQADTHCCHGYGAADTPDQQTQMSQDNDAVSRLRHTCQNVNSQETDVDSPECILDLDNSSPVSVDNDSEVDVNDTDVDNDSEVDVNDTDVDMSDNDDNDRDSLIISKDIYLREIRKDG